jgi:hypothetical protein
MGAVIVLLVLGLKKGLLNTCAECTKGHLIPFVVVQIGGDSLHPYTLDDIFDPRFQASSLSVQWIDYGMWFGFDLAIFSVV